MPNIKFYKGASSPSSADEGSVWFDKTNKVIKIKDSDWTQYGLGNNNLYEGNLQWGGKNQYGVVGPLDAALCDYTRANRFAFFNESNIIASYSRDGGSTWTSMSLSNAIFSTSGALYIGNSSEAGIDKSNYQYRVVLKTGGQLYAELNKFMIYCSTQGSQGCWVTIDCRTKANVENNVDSWTVYANKVAIGGWSGWNTINTETFRTNGGSSDQFEEIRFTFGVTSHPASVQYAGLCIIRIQAFGPNGAWTVANAMAQTGHLYDYDKDQNATFPANITANGTITGAKVYSEGHKVALTGSSNNLVSSGNEINLVDGYSGKASEIWLNYRNSNTKIENVCIGAGRSGQEDAGTNVASVSAAGYKVYNNLSASKVLTSDGGTKDISTLQVESANKLIWAVYED